MTPLVAAVVFVTGLAEPNAPARLIKSTSGTSGSVQGGRYVIADPRASFVAGSDRQIVVLFEWETTPGRNRCEASWRDPSGKVVLISPADFDARGTRFSAYWSLALPESPALGLWAVEATVNGQPAGTHTFQVTQGTGDANPPRPKTLGPKEIYALAIAATVAVEAKGAQGEALHTGSGFYIDDQRVVTSFQVVEGASSLRLVLPSGQQLDASAIVAANRRQDWALLHTAPSGVSPLSLAAKGSLSVGDRGVFLDVSPDGGRTIQEVSVVGRREVPGSGARLNLSSGATFAALGSPLLNEQGQVVGVMGGALPQGGTLPQGRGLRVAWGTIAVAPLAIPSDLLPDPSSLKAETFQVGELLTRGIAAPPVTRGRSVSYPLVGRGEVSARMGLTAESLLSRRDGTATVQITWDSSQKQDGEAVFGVYDLDNRPVVVSKPTRVKIRTNELPVSTWRFPLANLVPGVYRIDLTFGGGVAWREFLTVTD
jgi:S1-C subfamily serine protease